MSKLFFRYGAMGSSKTANALIVYRNYFDKGQTALLVKPSVDKRDGEKIIRSRTGLEHECIFIEDLVKKYLHDGKTAFIDHYDAVIVDEAQFLSKEQVDVLSDIVDFCDIPVICYGLRTDFKTELFEGSKRLFEVADVIEEVPTVCWCGKRAHINTRVVNGHIVHSGDQIVLGGNEKYVSLCRKHYKLGQIKKPE